MVIVRNPKGNFVYFDYCVVFLAIVANCVTLTAVIRGHFNLSGYRRFLISLAASDLYVCCVNVLTMVYQTYTAHLYNESGPPNASDTTLTLCGAKVLRTLQLAGFFASLLNIVGMSIDHFFGIVYPMNYRDLMSKNAARIAVGAIWLSSFLLAFLDIPINIALYQHVATKHPTSNGMLSGENSSDIYHVPGHRQQRSTSDLARESSVNNGFMQQNELATASSLGVLETIFRTLDNYDDAADNLSNTTLFTMILDRNRTDAVDQVLWAIRGDENYHVRHDDICTFFSFSKMWFEMCVIALALLCFVFLTICYGIILKKVSDRMDAGRKTTRKLIFTTVILLSAFMICWLPFMLFEFSMLIVFHEGNRATESEENEALLVKTFFLHNIFNSLLMTYPLIDPIIYAARIPAVQRVILQQIVKRFPHCCRCGMRYLNSINRHSISRPPQIRLDRMSCNEVTDIIKLKSGQMPLLQSITIGALTEDTC